MYKKAEMNLGRLMEEFDTEVECRDALAKLRWPEGTKCPRCQGVKHAYDSQRYVWDCQSCGYQFSVLTGTIFHDTHLPLSKWFTAVYLMTESKKGMSANQMKRMLNVSYKTAWYLCHRIRAAMREANPLPLTGTVEMDETYVGGKVRGKGKGYIGNKATVVGVVERGGDVRLQVVSGNDRKTLEGFLTANARPDRIYTDEHPSYKGRGDVHTNTIESQWSLVKRSIVGTYHQLSVKHLDAYLDEVEWRQNNRENKYLFRDTLMKLVASENLEYKELVS